jgi:alkylation response protein AidB-like acyl-CoA dehydrogenase
MFVESEMSRSALYAALSEVANGGSAVKAAAGAMSAIAQSARFVCESAIQLHGGMGMAEATEVGHHYRRALAREAQFGPANIHLQRYTSHGTIRET